MHALVNPRGEQNQGGLLNEKAKTRETTNPKALWDALFEEFESLRLENPREEWEARIRITTLMHELRLIQSFNWPSWDEPFPSVTQTKLMSMETALKHVFRIRRLDRFGEGLLASTIQSGLLHALCLVIREHTKGEIAPKVLSIASN
jgi:hypothetical protein